MTDTQNPTKKVFVVEDDVFLSSIMTSKITDHHFDVQAFGSGEAFMEALKTTLPDVLILDIFLPGKNGLEILKELRSDDRTKNLPVFVISNTDEKKDRDTATELGAKFIIKAVTDPDEIVKEISTVFTH